METDGYLEENEIDFLKSLDHNTRMGWFQMKTGIDPKRYGIVEEPTIDEVLEDPSEDDGSFISMIIESIHQ